MVLLEDEDRVTYFGWGEQIVSEFCTYLIEGSFSSNVWDSVVLLRVKQLYCSPNSFFVYFTKLGCLMSAFH